MFLKLQYATADGSMQHPGRTAPGPGAEDGPIFGAVIVPREQSILVR